MMSTITTYSKGAPFYNAITTVASGLPVALPEPRFATLGIECKRFDKRKFRATAHHSSCHSKGEGSSPGQFQHRDLRSGAESDGEASYANAAIDAELPATVFVQAPDVGYPHQAAEVEPAVDEIQRQLAAAVNVASQRQVDAQLGLIEGMRVVDQQNVYCVMHYQRFELLQSPVAFHLSLGIGCEIAPVVYPDQIKHLVTEPDRCALLAQHADTLGGEQARDGIFNPHVRFVVSHASD